MDASDNQRLQGIFRDVFMDPMLRIAPETSPAELSDWDSVAQVHIILAVEMEFGFRFSTEEVSKLKTVGDFLTTISLKTQSE